MVLFIRMMSNDVSRDVFGLFSLIFFFRDLDEDVEDLLIKFEMIS